MNNFKNKGCRKKPIKRKICIDCGIELTNINSWPTAFKHKQYRCILCANKKAREYHRYHILSQREGQIRLKNKIPKYPEDNICMLCEKPPTRRTGLSFHHWVIKDDIAYGIWLCNVCHMFAERVDQGYLEEYLPIASKFLVFKKCQ